MDELKEQERIKYEKMWELPQYSAGAPGEILAGLAIKYLKATPGMTFIDFGCGSGKGAAKLEEMGMKVIGVDHAHNALSEGVDIEFVVACLWDMPEMNAACGFCTDVMEHIPPERVETTLRSIYERVDKVFFQIATRPDKMGHLIDDTLHLTIKPALWWWAALSTFWDTECVFYNEREARFVCEKNLENEDEEL